MNIKSAAILYKGRVYVGRSHCEIGLQMLHDGVCPRPYPGGKAQGFVTDQDVFVSRERALTIAVASGQVVFGKTVSLSRLFSEDLRHDYSK